MSKSTNGERTLITSIVVALSIKRIPEPDIIKEIYNQTNKTITRKEIWNIRERIKKESYHWYKTMREGQFEYITVKQISLAALHKLNITLSQYFDICKYIAPNPNSLPSGQQGLTRIAM